MKLVAASLTIACGLCCGFAFAPVSTHAQKPGDAYADPASCLRCHAGIAASYSQTGMAQSFHLAATASQIEDFKTRNMLYNRASDRHYTMVEKDGALFEQRYQIGFDGKETNREEMRIDYIVGSGSHARTYLHRTAEGKLIELPVSWYSEAGGYWEMSPGYDNPHQQDFRRAIPYGCMACHNGYPSPDTAMTSSPDSNIFGPNLPEGIDCQRCHGPGEAHVEAVEDGESPEVIRAAIVNPARLSRDRQMDVCMQCHLETTSWPLPHFLRRFERGAFTYRPGEPLADYEFAFDHKSGTGFDDNFEVVHQAYQLRKSACFRKSRMTCITCHDPHRQLSGEEATRHYVALCKSCHTAAHASGIPAVETKDTQRNFVSEPNCITCHMGKRRTTDAVHVVMTDHDIQRFLPKGDPLAAKKSPGYYRGEVVAYYPYSLSRVPDGELYLAIAQIDDDANLQAGAERLRKSIDETKPAQAEFYFAMGTAYSKLGKNEEAIGWYQEALRRRPDYPQAQRAIAADFEAAGDLTHAASAGEKAASTLHPDTTVLTNLGDVYLKLGRLDDAERVLQQALGLNPDLPDAKIFLGMVSVREGDTESAESWYRSAINSQPDLADAHNNLAGILARRGNYPEAAYEFEHAEADDPANAQVHANYGVLLARMDEPEKAISEMKEAIRLEPKSTQFYVKLGDLLAKSDGAEAEQEYRAAVSLEPGNGLANLRLAEFLQTNGELAAARKYFQQAAKSSDPSIRQSALEALQR